MFWFIQETKIGFVIGEEEKLGQDMLNGKNQLNSEDNPTIIGWLKQTILRFWENINTLTDLCS